MNMHITLTLFGTRQAQTSALALLENCPQIRRVDSTEDGHTLRLTLCVPMSEGELIALMRSSGISGFRMR